MMCSVLRPITQSPEGATDHRRGTDKWTDTHRLYRVLTPPPVVYRPLLLRCSTQASLRAERRAFFYLRNRYIILKKLLLYAHFAK